MTPLRLCGAALLAAFALVVAGCGGGTASDGAEATADPISFRQLAQSASTSAEATSGRFSFEMSLTALGSDDPFALSGEGAFDQASGRSSFAVDMSSLAKLLGGFVAGLSGSSRTSSLPDFDDPAGWKIEVIQDGKVGYVRFPALDYQLPAGKSWIRGKEGEGSVGGFQFDELEGFVRSDPRDLLEALQGVAKEIETVGSEELRGVETTHYRAVLDPEELAKAKDLEGRSAPPTLVDQITSQSGLEPVPVDVWLDGDGLVRKLSMSLSATDATSSEANEAEISFELWDYGERVEIELPPASQVVEASAIRG